MSIKKLSEDGFHIIEFTIIIVVIAAIGFAGFKVLTNSDKKNASSEVKWTFDEQKLVWSTETGSAPACVEPLKLDRTPIDISQVTGVLMPGQYRNYSYKPHGGFGVPESTLGKVDVKMPIDGTLVGLTRYYEGEPPNMQYLLTFENDCGIAFRFDHMYTLSPELQALAEKTPEPKLNDTRTSPADAPPRTKFKSGQVIATQVGLPSLKIYGFDFGVYDYRSRNEISKNSTWADVHNQYQAQDWFGVCWFDMLPGSDPEVVKPLSIKQVDTRRTVDIISDYCPNAPHKTLEFNGGKPTER